MTPARTVIPRFLLPLQGPLWRGVRIPLSQNVHIRYASSSSSSSSSSSTAAAAADGPPAVLDKPARFSPPSHGARLKRRVLPRHYGPDLTPAEAAAQRLRQYPGLMAPEGSWAHWFWHNRTLHVCITMGTLLVMAITTFFHNYAYNSPFQDLIPPISDLWHQPGHFFGAWKDVILMDERYKSYKAREHRTRNVDDNAKCKYYRQMHGIETKNPVLMVFGKDEPKSDAELQAAARSGQLPRKSEAEEER